MTEGGFIQPEKMAPHSVESEEAVLGSVLINPDCLDDLTFLAAADFFIIRNGWIWDALQAIDLRGEAIDSLTVINELRVRGQLDSVGGPAYLMYLINNTPTHLHSETYARIIERAAIRRRLLAAASSIAQTALEENAEIGTVLDHAESTLLNVTRNHGAADLVPMYQLASTLYDRTQYLYENPDAIPGLSTGFKTLDDILDGLMPKSLYLLAARPAMGKTSLAVNISTRAAAARYPVAFFSMEMTREALTRRIIAGMTRINTKKLRAGHLDEREWSLYTEATADIAGYPLYIDDSGGLTPQRIAAKCRRLKRQSGLALVVIDYLQLMARDGRSEGATQDVSAISRALKLLAMELDVPVMALSQLSREVEKRPNKIPQLSDLRQSGSLEADADCVLFIYRDDAYHEHSERPNQADIIVAKQREGPTGTVMLYFRKEITAFEDAEKKTLDLTSWGTNGRKPVIVEKT